MHWVEITKKICERGPDHHPTDNREFAPAPEVECEKDNQPDPDNTA
jgi:hypothetical protein